MATKKEIVDTVRNLAGWNHHPKQVSMVINALYKMYVQQAMKTGDENFDFLAKEYAGQTIRSDAEGDYIDLPAAIVGLPTKTDGVLNIYNPSSGDLDYFPITQDEVRYALSTDVDTINTFTGYYVVGDKIRLYNYSGSPATASLVLAIEFDEFASTDEVNLPGGTDFNIIQLAVDMLRGQVPQDLKNDNNPAMT